jgi:Flp pilus assembly pilin Flp
MKLGMTSPSAHKIAQKKAGVSVGAPPFQGDSTVKDILYRLWHEEEGQDIAEYAVMLAVILVIVVGTIRLIGSNANNVFSSVASSIQ